MPISSVTYSKLFNLGNYENERFEATVALAEGQTPDQGLEEARVFVEAQAKNQHRRRRAVDDLEHAEARLASLNQQIEDQKKRVSEYKSIADGLEEFFGEHGLKLRQSQYYGQAATIELGPKPESATEPTRNEEFDDDESPEQEEREES